MLNSMLFLCFPLILLLCTNVLSRAASLLNQKGVEAEKCEVLSVVVAENRYQERENFQRTVRCVCPVGKIAGTHRESPACVPEFVVKGGLWCEMQPCLENETCTVLATPSGWLCTLDETTKRTIVKLDPLADPDVPTASDEPPPDNPMYDVTLPFVTSPFDDVTPPHVLTRATEEET